MDRVDALVIGAGAVGLAVARALAQAGHETVVAESRNAIGQGVSSRNSEVIHAGLYYPPGSLKAKLCVRGKELLYTLCDSHGVGHRRCGKLTVANSDAERGALRRLQERAAANGVPVQWLEGAQAPSRIAVAQHRRGRQPRLHAGAARGPGARRRHGRP
jgi:L-2-hydroxyglutarate oxidase LhgO